MERGDHGMFLADGIAGYGSGPRPVCSVAGILSLLDEDVEELHVYAINTLERVVDMHWAEIAASIAVIESFAEEEDFKERKRASLLASKVFYHLGEMQDALTYAMGADELFDPMAGSEYTKTMLSSCIDAYVTERQKADSKSLAGIVGSGENDESVPVIDERLETIVHKMFKQCVLEDDYQQAVGFALESRRLDLLREAVRSSSQPSAALEYALKICNAVIVSRVVRQAILKELVTLFEEVPIPDYVSICQCHMFLEDPGSVATILEDLLKTKTGALVAYQVAFDLSDNELQSFLDKVKQRFPEIKPPTPPAAPEDAEADGQDEVAKADVGEEDVDAMDTDEKREPEPTLKDEPNTKTTEDTNVDETSPAYDPEYANRSNTLRSILSSEASVNLSLEFLYSNNHADIGILNGVKRNIEARNSVCHGAMVHANAIAHAGTTVDTFLRENLDWLSKAVNWAKFSATAGLGVIHKGHIKQSRALMAPYLPRNGVAGSSYSEGGGLYALGLIHSGHGEGIRTYLLDSLRNTTNETTQHGACLGLGLVTMGTNDEAVYEALREVLYTDNAVAGEAAGIALGLLMVGQASERSEEMLAYAHDTSHEKIIRGTALGLAITVYGLEEEAEAMIEQMVRDQDPIIRYGGIFAVGLAYRGTANNRAMRRLLHFAVSDVNDDVRRAAVLNLGFVLCAVPEQCPRTVSLLAESYNPHVRYGAAMAVGISAAGTGLHEARLLLEPLLSDTVDFVRQGALIAMSMVLVQQPDVSSFRKYLDKFIGDKHEDTMCKMGAIMAVGILDAGGRNTTISLRSRSGFFRMNAVVGLALFVQYWFWYPLSYMLSLSLVPTAIICVNEELKMPKMDIVSNTKPSLFAYPPPISNETSKNDKIATKAVLSTAAARAKTRAKKETEKDAEKENIAKTSAEEVATDQKGKESSAVKEEAIDMDLDVDVDASVKDITAKPAAEPLFTVLANPSRVVSAQEKYIKFEDKRFKPIKVRSGGNRCAGIVVVEDTNPERPLELISNMDNDPSSSNQAGEATAKATDGKNIAEADAGNENNNDNNKDKKSNTARDEDNDDDDDDAEPPAAFDVDC